MALVETVVLRDPHDIERQLAEMKLGPAKRLMGIAEAAAAAGAEATPFHPANAEGTLAYQHGTFHLRAECVGKDGWEADRLNGVEVIGNSGLMLAVAYTNVDRCCVDGHQPKPRSAKGSGAERASNGDLFAGTLPHYVQQPIPGLKLFYLMVGEDGSVELSRPIISEKTFKGCSVRIYLGNINSPTDVDKGKYDTGDAADDFDPQVVRK